MIFTLEALRARHGDALIVHFGETRRPRLIVIDGGPTGVYRDALRPRLDELAQRLAPDGPLAIDLLMVSHIDDDHIRGVLDLTSALLEERRSRGVPFEVATVWHNAFDDLVGEGADELAAGVAETPSRVAAAEGDASFTADAGAVVAGVAQGRRLRDELEGLKWQVNRPFERFVMAPARGGRTVEFGPLRLTVVCPLRPQLEALQRDWDRKLRELRRSRRARDAAAVAEYLDKSVYNLSSIVCLAEEEGRRMLLTGDARGDHILEGLEAADLLDDDGKIDVDVLKLPHHGSDRNVEEDFFRRVRARHYIASGDGEHHNPEVATFRMLSAARPDDDFVLHLTYRDCKDGVGEELAEFFAGERKAGRRYEVNFRSEDRLSLRVDLLEEVSY